MTTFIFRNTLSNYLRKLKQNKIWVGFSTVIMKTLSFRGDKIAAGLIIAGVIIGNSVFGAIIPQEKTETLNQTPATLPTVQGNSLLGVYNPSQPLQPVKKMNAIITAYSSTPEQTDNDPFITASGKYVKDGIVANNILPFGTQIRIPEIYGDKIFTVEDRMRWDRSDHQFDIWFSDYWQAKNFGAQRTYIEILKN